MNLNINLFRVAWLTVTSAKLPTIQGKGIGIQIAVTQLLEIHQIT
jgi:hypothetical protein